MMTNLKIYKLHFTTPVHFGDNRGDYGISLTTIQSDTLYSAVISCLAEQGEKIPDDGDLGFTISSLFPFYQKDKNDKNSIYFFPKPLLANWSINEQMAEHIKAIKKISWLDTDHFSKLINGLPIFNSVSYLSSIHKNYMSASSTFDDEFIKSHISPRVTVSRDGSEDSRLFYMDRVCFKDYSGLFFICEGNTSLLEKGLNLLRYEGIGTDRNVGNGLFEYDTDIITLDIPEYSDTAMSLSMFIPENKAQLSSMIQGEKVAYDFTRRGGWITTPPHNSLRKNIIYAFLPSSVFSLSIKELSTSGKIVNLAPDVNDITESLRIKELTHPIWRTGKSLFIPVKL